MALNADNQWLTNVLAYVEGQTILPPIKGVVSVTNTGKQCLIVNGFEYRKDKVIRFQTFQKWRCTKRNCNGTAKTNFGSVDGLHLVNNHVCRNSLNAFARRDLIAKAKSSTITNFGSSSSDIISTGKNGLTDQQLLSLPTNKALQDRVLRQTKPAGVRSVDKAAREITWLNFFTQKKSGEEFLIQIVALLNQNCR